MIFLYADCIKYLQTTPLLTGIRIRAVTNIIPFLIRVIKDELFTGCTMVQKLKVAVARSVNYLEDHLVSHFEAQYNLLSNLEKAGFETIIANFIFDFCDRAVYTKFPICSRMKPLLCIVLTVIRLGVMAMDKRSSLFFVFNSIAGPERLIPGSNYWMSDSFKLSKSLTSSVEDKSR